MLWYGHMWSGRSMQLGAHGHSRRSESEIHAETSWHCVQVGWPLSIVVDASARALYQALLRHLLGLAMVERELNAIWRTYQSTRALFRWQPPDHPPLAHLLLLCWDEYSIQCVQAFCPAEDALSRRGQTVQLLVGNLTGAGAPFCSSEGRMKQWMAGCCRGVPIDKQV